MRIILGTASARLLVTAVALSGATLLVAVGCGGGSSSSGSSGGSGGSSGAMGGDTSTGGTSAGGTSNTGGSTTTGGSGQTGGEAGAPVGEGGEAGATDLPPAKDHSSVTFVAGGAISSSKKFTLIGNIGENLGGTGKVAKSLKHSYIPGVIAAATP